MAGDEHVSHKIDKMGWYELHNLAIKNEPVEIKDSVLIRGAIVRERAELSVMTALHKACMYGRLSVFQELLELGAYALASTA